MTVSAEQRSGLSRAVSRLRVLFEDDYAAVLEGTYGIHVSGRRAGEIEAASALSLSAHQIAARAEVVGVVEYLEGEGLGPVEAVERMLREATFTTVNRLLAVRVAEAIGVLPPSLVEGRLSLGFVETLEVFPLLRDADSSGGYWSYLQVCGDELSHAVPRLFDRRNPLSVLEPSSETLDAAVEILSDSELAGVWVEPEALGWSYQFFNTQEERSAMRDASQAPRDSRELAVRNQFFTPSYVVDFLVENTLGRRLRESGSELDLPLLLGEIDEDAPPLDLNKVSVLDPAVGSGHFLLGAYDLLERAWEEQGVGAADAAPVILGSLFGVDIDPRAAQVAQTVLYLRARRSAPDSVLDAPSIVTARALPKDPEVWVEVLHDAPPLVRDVVQGLGEILEQAPVLGSLLKPEEYLREAIGERLDAPHLGDEALGTFADVEAMVLDAAERVASQAAASPAERLFAADASDALGFVGIMTRRYDTVLMNPPFGLSVPETQAVLKLQYDEEWTDLYACFVRRGVLLLRSRGRVGAITSSQYLFSRKLRSFRRSLLHDHRPESVIDLGPGVLHDATVNAALMCVPDCRSSGTIAYMDLTRSVDKDRDLAGGLDSARQIDASALGAVDGTPFAFHVPDVVLRRWGDAVRLEPDVGLVRTGNNTFDDFRFVRLRWEVSPSESGAKSGWVPFNKGGEYQPYLSPTRLVLDWRSEGRELRDLAASIDRLPQVMQSSSHWWKSGISYPRMSSVGFGARVQPSGEIFSGHSICVFLNPGVDPLLLLGLLNSTAVAELLRVFGRGRATENGAMKALPIDQAVVEAMLPSLPKIIRLVSIFGELEGGDESSPYFYAPSSGSGSLRISSMSDRHRSTMDAARSVQRALDEDSAAVLGVVDRIDEAVVDRSDLVARPFSLKPTVDTELSGRVLSYLAGSSFGRWDVRVGKDPSLAPALGDPFDSLPVCPPGMLTGDDGLPVAEAPAGYPISLPPDRILHDDPGHPWDIVARMEDAAGFLFDDPDGELREALGHLKAKDLRSYLRTKFFPQHLKRYSKSRRKAPIYWYLAVPSKEWGLWVYAPWLSREQLFAIARAAQDKMRRLSDEASQLRRDVDAGGGRADRERLEAAEALLEEVAEFHAVADSVAQSGWEPDLNDGIILNAAPLQELFADKKWRTDVEKHRKKMIAGDYSWATVQTTYYDRIES